MCFWILLTLPFAADLWLSQFEQEDRQTASELIEYIDYFSYERIDDDLKKLHVKLKPHIENELVVYSKTYVAKSGDLISYFYRTANKIPSVLFKNLSDPVANMDEKILVLLEDYVGTGIQFLYRTYANEHYENFNQYKKVYLVALVANKIAIDNFSLIKSDKHDRLADVFISYLNRPKDDMLRKLTRIPSDKIELIYLHEEKPLSSVLKSTASIESISALIEKYGKYSMYTNFFNSLSMDSYGHTAFFYSCPNNLPAILWDANLKQANGLSWIPLLKRTEDISIYESVKTVSLEE